MLRLNLILTYTIDFLIIYAGIKAKYSFKIIFIVKLVIIFKNIY